MTNRTLLNNVDHHDLKVAIRHGAEFGDSVNQMLIFPNEFEAAQREFTILFRRDGEGAMQAFALLGLDRSENLFLGEDGWRSRYVPALQRRGPFLIGRPREGGEPTIHVDLDDPRIGRDQGEPLFLKHGGNAPYLEHVAEALRTAHIGLELVNPMFAAFEALALLRPVTIEIRIDDSRQYTLPDHFTIDEERLAGLSAAGLEQLHRGGFLRAAFMAAASLGNIGRLIELKNRKGGAALR